MFSTDKNVETLAGLIANLKDYLKLRSDYMQLDMTEKAIRILSLIVLSIALWFFFILVVFFLSFAAAYWLNIEYGLTLPVSFLVVSGFHAIVLLTVYLKRHSWIEKPLVKSLANILMNKK